MSLDFATLTAAGGLVALVCGLLLIFAWTQYSGDRAALWLGVSHLAGATAIIFLAVGVPQSPLLTFLAQPVFVLAALLAVASILAFTGRERPTILLLFAAAALAVMFSLKAADADTSLIRTAQLMIIAPAYFVAAAVLWHGREEKLSARLPLAGMFVLHGLINVLGIAEVLLRDALPSGVPSFTNWYGLIHIESMMYFIGTSLFMVVLLKERSEFHHRTASLTDPLTGLPNRRAFFEACDRMLESCRRAGTPLAVLALDLDRFKAVNDTFGHAVGDRVLQIFAAVARAQMRSTDIVGRLGGEEFSILLPRAHNKQAEEFAERIRAEFSYAARLVDGHDVGATLSVGIASAFGPESTIAEALERADAALYRAKLNGRNRVELDPAATSIRLVRVAQ